MENSRLSNPTSQVQNKPTIFELQKQVKHKNDQPNPVLNLALRICMNHARQVKILNCDIEAWRTRVLK